MAIQLDLIPLVVFEESTNMDLFGNLESRGVCVFSNALISW